jgi:NADPH-dependent 2,4-dienoyl-CoA reductase/sulfur reductase-like enzyme
MKKQYAFIVVGGIAALLALVAGLYLFYAAKQLPGGAPFAATDTTTDVVIVGAGGAGLAAAI